MTHRPTRRRLLAALPATALPLAGLPLAARAAEAWPSRPVRLVVSYAAGNITDVLARLVATRFAEQWKQPVVVENRPGQGGSLGAQIVSTAPAEGYTLLFSAMAAMAINPHVYARVGYDPLKDFTPIVALARPQGVLYVNAELPVRTLEELVAYSRANPGKLNYGTAGNGTVPHMNIEALKTRTGLDATHVPYKAAVAVLNDVVGGQIHFSQESVGVVLPQIQAGKIRPLVSLGSGRIPQLPDVPAVAERVPGFQSVTPWLALFGPAGLPKPVVERVDASVAAVLKDPEMLSRLASAGLEPMSTTPAGFGAMVAADHERLGKLVQALKLKAD
jgi:tripartite-type tricarboxylate transporter receptor subunit TctC